MDPEDSLPEAFAAELQGMLKEAEARAAISKSYGAPALKPGTHDFAQLIDHTILKLDTTDDAVIKVCEEAKLYNFKSVCVRPHHVRLASQHLHDTPILVCSVVCFPEGTQTTAEKIAEAQQALQAGAAELDFVVNYPQLLARDYAAVHAELRAIVAQVTRAPAATARAAAQGPTLKLILETSQLAPPDVVAACLLAWRARFDFVKTSTGFCGHGATEEHVRLMRAVCDVCEEAGGGRRMRVKASGGVRTADVAWQMVDAGAERLGLSGSVAIMEEGRSGGKAAVANDGY